jgi:diphosphomevalonate decarboxylase
MSRVRARACANVALAKYWGKRDERLNLPLTGSISVTLGGLETVADVRLVHDSSRDSVRLNGVDAPPAEAERIARFVDLVRQFAGVETRAEVDIESNFPVAAGLASSASTFAALALASSRAYGLTLEDTDLSVLARRGSGSAARSIHGGFVEWRRGTAPDGSDSHGIQLAPATHWQLGIVVAIVDEGPKRIGSTEGMARSVRDSPFLRAWVETHEADLDEIRAGIEHRDLARVGETAEHNCLKMHAAALAARPGLLYWRPGTVAVIEAVRALRDGGVAAYFTIDAGPQVKILCRIEERDQVAEQIANVPGVRRVLLSAPGPGAEVLPPL